MNIYVGNLSYETRENDLQELFAPFGKVDVVRVITDRDSGRSKGFAFVEMASKTEAEAAIQGLNGKELHSRSLTVNEARPRTEGGDRGGFRGGSGGNRDGGRPRRW